MGVRGTETSLHDSKQRPSGAKGFYRRRNYASPVHGASLDASGALP